MSFITSKSSGIVILYRWRVDPFLEDSFIESWSRIARLLKSERGSLGSRLHRASDGLWYSYAQWPSERDRLKAFAAGSVDPEASECMDRAIVERFPEILLESVADFLAPALGSGT